MESRQVLCCEWEGCSRSYTTVSIVLCVHARVHVYMYVCVYVYVCVCVCVYVCV